MRGIIAIANQAAYTELNLNVFDYLVTLPLYQYLLLMITKKPTKISGARARSIILQAQLLAGYKPVKNPLHSAQQIIEHLGYVQIDTIAVVERAHEHIFWSRNTKYEPGMVNNLLQQRKVFEYWTHAMSYVPMTDYRYYLPRMKNFQSAKNNWFLTRESRSKHLAEYILDRIRDEGPLGAKDFEDNRVGKNNGWWDWKPAKDALEVLFWQGKLMITERNKFQKRYDLPERVVPDTIDTSFPNEQDTAAFLVGRALQSLGLCSKKDLHNYLHPEGARDSDMRACSPAAVDRALAEALESGSAASCLVAGGDETEYFLTADALTHKSKTPAGVHILSPFDNLVIKRERLNRLFGFDYTIECYVPQPKRKYGYFVLPVLYNDSFVARIDAKADRKSGTLLLQNLHAEQGTDIDEWLPETAIKVMEFARFNGMQTCSMIKHNLGKYLALFTEKIKEAEMVCKK